MPLLILAAGAYPTHPRLLAKLSDPASRVICCDSAAEAFVRHTGRLPWRIVGDLDSLTPELRETASHLVRHIPEQETNDLTKAVRYAAAHGHRCLELLGCTGLREDHTLGNISLLLDYRRQGLDVVMHTDHGTFHPCAGDVQMPVREGAPVSIFNFTCTRMAGRGLQYPLRPFTSWWQGTLNRATAPQIHIHADGEYIVFVCG